jgi:hypothetical protein
MFPVHFPNLIFHRFTKIIGGQKNEDMDGKCIKPMN